MDLIPFRVGNPLCRCGRSWLAVSHLLMRPISKNGFHAMPVPDIIHTGATRIPWRTQYERSARRTGRCRYRR